MIDNKSIIKVILAKAKRENKVLYDKLKLVTLYEKLGVDMYMLPDKENPECAHLYLPEYRFDVPNHEIACFVKGEIDFKMYDEDYETVWYVFFDHIKYMDSVIDVNNNESFCKITKRWSAYDKYFFDIDEENNQLIIGNFILSDEELGFCPMDFGWEYDKNTRKFTTSISPIVVEDGINSYNERVQYIIQKIDRLREFFITLHLWYDKD